MGWNAARGASHCLAHLAHSQLLSLMCRPCGNNKQNEGVEWMGGGGEKGAEGRTRMHGGSG